MSPLIARLGCYATRHDVGSRAIADGAVRAVDISSSAIQAKLLLRQITTDEIRDGAIADAAVGTDQVADAVTTSKLADGSVAAAKLVDTAAARLRGWEIVSASNSTSTQPVFPVEARCPAGNQVGGGGGSVDTISVSARLFSDIAVVSSAPIRFVDGMSGWCFLGRCATSRAPGWWSAYATCGFDGLLPCQRVVRKLSAPRRRLQGCSPRGPRA